MFYEEIRSEHINLLIKYSVQQQFHFNGNGFGNKCYRCNESSLYLKFVLSLFAPSSFFSASGRLRFVNIFVALLIALSGLPIRISLSLRTF